MKKLHPIIAGLIVIMGIGMIPLTIQAQQPLNLMPYPSRVQLGKEKVRVTGNFTISVTNGTDRLYRAATRFVRRLDGRTGLFLTQERINSLSQSDTAVLKISITREGLLELDEDETYELSVTPKGVMLEADTDLGALRGLETLLQLLTSDKSGYYFPEVKISDEPRFPWRGLLIDVSRHWIPLEIIKRNIDGMAAVKMNVLHLHLTDDQGFRIESKKFPLLHELGSNGNFFTQEQIRELIAYADDRGIRIVPEFDMPGHTTSWFVGYPELASAAGPYAIENQYGIKDPTMDPTKESTYQFLDTFLGEMATLFPDRFFHIGGDENNGKQWDANPDIQSFMKRNGLKSNHELQGYFNERLLNNLDKYGKRMMGWDEIFQPGVPEDILIQSWRGKESLMESARKGYQAILSNGYYIDLLQPASYHYQNDPIPADADLNSDERLNILGGEAAMWSEIVTRETIDSRIWPRTAAIAERLWSPSDIDDVEDMYKRLDRIAVQLEELGLQHESYYDMMLRRLSSSLDYEAARVLVDVIEPVEGYRRHMMVKWTTYSPFTRLADAAHPESRIGRQFNTLIRKHLESGTLDYVPDIKDWLLLWVENHKKFEEVASRSHVLKDAVTLSLDLSNISKIGLQALSTSVNHTSSWKTEANKMLDAALQPRMECEITVVEAIRSLVEAAE